jgi:hypothetical protein
VQIQGDAASFPEWNAGFSERLSRLLIRIQNVGVHHGFSLKQKSGGLAHGRFVAGLFQQPVGKSSSPVFTPAAIIRSNRIHPSNGKAEFGQAPSSVAPKCL